MVEAGHGGGLRQGHRQDGRKARHDPQHVLPAQELGQLGGDPLGADEGQKVLLLLRGPGRGLLQREAQLRREAQGAEDAQGVLFKAVLRPADAADQAAREVRLPAEEVDQAPVRAPGHRVDGKIPPGEVLPQIGREADRVGVAVVGIGRLAAVGRDLQRLAAQKDGDGAVLEAGQDHPIAGEDGLHLLRQGRGGEIVVPGRMAQQSVAHAAADETGLKARLVQPPDGRKGVGGEIRFHGVLLYKCPKSPSQGLLGLSLITSRRR